jgi:hypothetical protein
VEIHNLIPPHPYYLLSAKEAPKAPKSSPLPPLSFARPATRGGQTAIGAAKARWSERDKSNRVRGREEEEEEEGELGLMETTAVAMAKWAGCRKRN